MNGKYERPSGVDKLVGRDGGFNLPRPKKKKK